MAILLLKALAIWVQDELPRNYVFLLSDIPIYIEATRTRVLLWSRRIQPIPTWLGFQPSMLIQMKEWEWSSCARWLWPIRVRGRKFCETIFQRQDKLRLNLNQSRGSFRKRKLFQVIRWHNNSLRRDMLRAIQLQLEKNSR